MTGRRAILGLVGLGLVGGILWIATRGTHPSVGAVEPVGRAPAGSSGDPRALEATPPARVVESAQPTADEPSSAIPLVEPEGSDVAPAAAAPAPVPDLEARVPIEIRVVDEQGVPVREARVEIGGMRREGDAGSWYSYRGTKPRGRTDLEGRVRLEHWEWVTIDGRTRCVDLSVEHPDFIPFRDSSFAVGPGEHPVVLRRGSTVVVSAWIDSPSQRVGELEIHLDDEADLPPSAWKRQPDGRLATDRIEPGPHLLRAQHLSEELGLCFSEVQTLVLAEGAYEELELELRPAATLRGELEPSVPRPIVDGHVRVVMTAGGVGALPSLYGEFEAAVAADGSFAVESLPPGDGCVFALCRGWVSKKTRADSPDQVGRYIDSSDLDPQERAKRLEKALDEMGERANAHQRVRIPRTAAPLVVLMEPTASIEVQVVREDDTPVLGATVSINPNLYVPTVGSWMVPWREWTREVDSTGRARFEDVPAHGTVWVNAHHPELQMRKTDREEHVRVPVRAGETSQARVVLEPK